MQPASPLPLTHSWPLLERGRRFDLGQDFPVDDRAWPGIDAFALDPEVFAARGIGVWECNLADNAIRWSADVYAIFGLPRDAALSRAETVALYAEGSRAAMERLRAYAIKHRRGFTLDAEIAPAAGHRRWMRLVAAPVCVGGHVVRLHGLKHDVSDEYR